MNTSSVQRVLNEFKRLSSDEKDQMTHDVRLAMRDAGLINVMYDDPNASDDNLDDTYEVTMTTRGLIAWGFLSMMYQRDLALQLLEDALPVLNAMLDDDDSGSSEKE